MKRINYKRHKKPMATATFTDDTGTVLGMAYFYTKEEVGMYRALVRQMNLKDESRPVLTVHENSLLKRAEG